MTKAEDDLVAEIGGVYVNGVRVPIANWQCREALRGMADEHARIMSLDDFERIVHGHASLWRSMNVPWGDYYSELLIACYRLACAKGGQAGEP